MYSQLTLNVSSNNVGYPYATVLVQETAINEKKNTSTLTVKMVINRPELISKGILYSVNLNVAGIRYAKTGDLQGSGELTVINEKITVPHDKDGKKTINVAANLLNIDETILKQGAGDEYYTEDDTRVNPYFESAIIFKAERSAFLKLYTIPQYAAVKTALISKTENTAQIQYTCDNVIDYLWYSTDSGAHWYGINVADGASGTFTVNGLSPGTKYQIGTRVRRKDTQLNTVSKTVTVTTLSYPYAKKMPNFTIGNPVTIGLYNPLLRPVTVELVGADGNVTASRKTEKESIKFDFTDAEITKLLKSIPYAKSGTYKVRVKSGTLNHIADITTIKTGGTYQIKSSVKPVIGSVKYTDTNSDMIAITLNPQLVVQNRSTVTFTVSGISAGANSLIKSVVVSVNDVDYICTVSGAKASVSGVVIDSDTNVQATVTVTDKRGQQATKSVTVKMIEWFLPTAIINIKREENYYTPTNVYVNAEWASLNGKNAVTIRLRYKKKTASAWSAWQTMTDEETRTFQLDNASAWNVQVVLTDIIGSTTYNLLVPRGLPIIYFDSDKHSAGVNCFPADEDSFEVDGVNIIKQLFFFPGDTWSLGSYSSAIPGVVSNGAKDIWFLVPSGKSLAKVSSIAVNALTGGIRSAQGGYLNGEQDGYDWTSDSGITISAHKSSEYLIQLKFSATTAFTNTLTNMPCSLLASDLQFTFS